LSRRQPARDHHEQATDYSRCVLARCLRRRRAKRAAGRRVRLRAASGASGPRAAPGRAWRSRSGRPTGLTRWVSNTVCSTKIRSSCAATQVVDGQDHPDCCCHSACGNSWGLVPVTGQTAVSCVLRLELHEFSQLFDTPQRSRAMLQGNATLLDARHRIVAERGVASEQPAATDDARGGVMALVAASEALGRQLATWLNDLEKAGRLRHCRSTAGEDQ
jgi:hypothetical protein